MLSLIQQETGGDFKTALNEALHFLGGQSHYQHQQTPEQINQREKRQADALRMAKSEQAKKLAHVQAIALDTVPIKGTLAEHYLTEHRAIRQPLDSDNLRFHPALKNWSNGQTYPALVVLAHDADGKLSGLQATFLDSTTANKAHLTEGNNKLSRGTIAQGSVVHQAITENKKPTIALAEGLETALSVACAHPDWEVRLTFGVSNFEKAIKHTQEQQPDATYVLCQDNDGIDSGTAKAVKKAVENLNQQGINVHVVEPEKPAHIEKWDFNDALKASGVEAIRNNLDNGLFFQKKQPQTVYTITPELNHHDKIKPIIQEMILANNESTYKEKLKQYQRFKKTAEKEKELSAVYALHDFSE